MIFVTVGEQLPFDRLIHAVDEWASVSGQEVFAQIGRSALRPVHIAYKEFLAPDEFKEKFLAAEFVVAHAGMGTIISALELGKPILVMPRKAALGEVRNEHQLATARRFLTLNYISVALDEIELRENLDNLGKAVMNQSKKKIIGPPHSLLTTIREFIEAKVKD